MTKWIPPLYHYEGGVGYIRADDVAERIGRAYRDGQAAGRVFAAILRGLEADAVAIAEPAA